MHKIETKGVAFNGQVGPVRFADGVAHTDHPSMLAHFRREPDRYAVTELDAPEGEPDEQPEGEPDGNDNPGDDATDDAPEGDNDPDAGDQGEDPEDEGEDEDEPELAPEDEPEPETEGEQPDEADPYDRNVSELRRMASQRSLPTAGSKAELQERLRAYDAEQQS